MRRIFPLFALMLGLTAAPAAAQHLNWDLHEVAWLMKPAADGETIDMEMSLNPLLDRDRVVVRIPLWRPGSYRYANYQDRIKNLRAVDQNGTERSILELEPRAWEIDAAGATSLKVLYTLTTTNEADEGETPAVHLRSPMTFLYTEDTKHLSHTLRVELPSGWDFASGHRADASEEGLLRSPDYDVFVDCPIALGGLERHSFMSHGVEIEWVLFGRLPTDAEFSREEWSRKLQAISETGYDIFGSYPFEKYTYLFLLNGIGGVSGLEHLNSTSILVNHRGVKNGSYIEILESVTAHEFFHLWNVKRIRPEQLGPFDYTQDVRSTDLWWAEGITSYYNDVMLQRAGLRPDGWFWSAQSSNFLSVRRSPGYGNNSPERSSWTVWDPDPSKSISYYSQGQMLGLLLDIKIRAHTENQRSLDDVLAFLSRWIDYPGPGYSDDELQKAIYAVTGWDCEQFFDRHIEGLVEPPFAEVLPLAGLNVTWIEADDPYVGLGFGEGLELAIREGTPAGDAGLQTGDRLLAIGEDRVRDLDEVRAALAVVKPGQEIMVRVRRGGSTKDVTVLVAERGRTTFRISEAEDATPEQIAIREGVLTGTPNSI
jgi:predicted metalloprotease with PDZ domain